MEGMIDSKIILAVQNYLTYTAFFTYKIKRRINTKTLSSQRTQKM